MWRWSDIYRMVWSRYIANVMFDMWHIIYRYSRPLIRYWCLSFIYTNARIPLTCSCMYSHSSIFAHLHRMCAFASHSRKCTHFHNKFIHCMKWLVAQPLNANCVTRVTLGDHWDGDQWEICTQGYVGGHWDEGPMTNENCVTRVTVGDRWYGDQSELCNQGYTGGQMRWRTNENCVTRVMLEDQWDGLPMRTVYPRLLCGTHHQWNGRPMKIVYPVLRRGTNEMGVRWELCNQGYIGGPLRWGTNKTVVPGMHWETNEMGDQWEQGRECYSGGPMRRETEEFKQYSGGLMNWGPNDKGTNAIGDQWYVGPMSRGGVGVGELRWETNGMGGKWTYILVILKAHSVASEWVSD